MTGRLAKVAVFQQTSSAMTWLGNWGTSSWSGASAGSARFATARNAKATFTFTGSGVAWVAAKGPTRGSASVYVDGEWVRSVSLYASTSQSRAIVFSQNWTAIGTHTVTVVVAGDGGPPARRRRRLRPADRPLRAAAYRGRPSWRAATDFSSRRRRVSSLLVPVIEVTW